MIVTAASANALAAKIQVLSMIGFRRRRVQQRFPIGGGDFLRFSGGRHQPPGLRSISLR
jgi:hypothetical protein